jgi:hypothetical protein
MFAEQAASLSVPGQEGSASVVHVHNRNYVDVEELARVVNGSIQFEGNRIILTLSGRGSLAGTVSGFSKPFVAAGIEAIAQQREWRAALNLAIQGGYPLDSAWLARFRARAQDALQKASVSADTDADRNALSFLAIQLSNMDALTGKYLEKARTMSYIDPKSLRDDPLDLRIAACNSSLASMATANEFIDDGTCR